MDGSLRIWTRSEEQIFASEEQEKILETELDKELERTDKAGNVLLCLQRTKYVYLVFV
jgi:hypothetical protein